jgi:hypothetical protein
MASPRPKRVVLLQEEDLPCYHRMRKRFQGVSAELQWILGDEAALSALESTGVVSLIVKDGRKFIAVADASSYLRSSRYASLLSLGSAGDCGAFLERPGRLSEGLGPRPSVLTAPGDRNDPHGS